MSKIKPIWTPITGLRGWQIGHYEGPRGSTWYGRRYVDGRYVEKRLDGVTTQAAAELAVRQWKAHEVGVTEEEREALFGLHVAALGLVRQDWEGLLPTLPGAARSRKAKPAPAPAPMLTVADAINAYMVVRPGAPTRSMMKHVLDHAIAGRPLAELTRRDLEQWQRHGLPAKDGDKAKRTRNRVFAQFKAALNLAHRDHPASVPSDRAWRGLAPLKVEHGRRDALTDEEFAALLAVAQGAFRTLVMSIAYTGARGSGELAPCIVSDFDPKRRTLLIRGTKGTGDRVVNLCPVGTAWFAGLVEGKAPGDVLVPNANGQPWETWRATKAFRAARKRAGLRADATLYCIRHAHATAAIYNGRGELLTARQLGTSVKMLEKTYIRALAGRTQAIVDATAPTFALPDEGR